MTRWYAALSPLAREMLDWHLEGGHVSDFGPYGCRSKDCRFARQQLLRAGVDVTYGNKLDFRLLRRVQRAKGLL